MILETSDPTHQRIAIPDHHPLRLGTFGSILRDRLPTAGKLAHRRPERPHQCRRGRQECPRHYMCRSRKRTAARYASSQLLCSRKSWTSSGNTSSSTSTFCWRSASASITVWLNCTSRIVVALDQQHRRAPSLDIGHGRSFECHAIVRRGGRYVQLGGPIVHAVEIDSGAEEIGRASQGHGGEVAAVGAAPGADARGVDIAARPQIDARALNVVVLAAARSSVVRAPRGNPDRTRCRCDN